MAATLEKGAEFSVSVEEDEDDPGLKDEDDFHRVSPDEFDHYEFNETEDLDDKNAIRIILKVTAGDIFLPPPHVFSKFVVFTC